MTSRGKDQWSFLVCALCALIDQVFLWFCSKNKPLHLFTFYCIEHQICFLVNLGGSIPCKRGATVAVVQSQPSICVWPIHQCMEPPIQNWMIGILHDFAYHASMQCSHSRTLRCVQSFIILLVDLFSPIN